MSWVFLAAYACSGIAGLVYEVAWTRQLTLHLGHTTAAASAVVGAFLLGLAIGAAAIGRLATRLSRSQALYGYAALELGVAACALALPWELAALTPVLRWAYQDGAPGLLFPLVRVLSCLPMVLVPAVALGATFPLAIRWFAVDSKTPARRSAMLYATNTAGAAVGALVAGFVLIPSLGLRGTTAVGVAASTLSALTVLGLARRGTEPAVVASPARGRRPKGRDTAVADAPQDTTGTDRARLALAAVVLAASGFAALVHEIAWTRILAMVLGPTTYAFAATLAAVIAGTAMGSWAGTWLVGRARRPASPLALLLATAAIVTGVTYSLAGGPLPYFVAERIRDTPAASAAWGQSGAWLTAALVVPTAACLGAAFTLGLAVAGATSATASAALWRRLRRQHRRLGERVAGRRLPADSVAGPAGHAAGRRRGCWWPRRWPWRSGATSRREPGAPAWRRRCWQWRSWRSRRPGIARCSPAAATSMRRSCPPISSSARCCVPAPCSSTPRAPRRPLPSSGSPAPPR